jgi:hypothetical protein
MISFGGGHNLSNSLTVLNIDTFAVSSPRLMQPPGQVCIGCTELGPPPSSISSSLTATLPSDPAPKNIAGDVVRWNQVYHVRRVEHHGEG